MVGVTTATDVHSFASIHTAIPTIIRFSVREMNPSGTLLLGDSRQLARDTSRTAERTKRPFSATVPMAAMGNRQWSKTVVIAADRNGWVLSHSAVGKGPGMSPKFMLLSDEQASAPLS